MPQHVVCPNCADGAHAECTGPGCYCDCQIPSDGPRMELDDDLDEGCQFGHDEIDECDECAGCRECGNCVCGEDDPSMDEYDGGCA